MRMASAYAQRVSARGAAQILLADDPMAGACVRRVNVGGGRIYGVQCSGTASEDGLRMCTGAEVPKQEDWVCSVLSGEERGWCLSPFVTNAWL